MVMGNQKERISRNYFFFLVVQTSVNIIKNAPMIIEIANPPAIIFCQSVVSICLFNAAELQSSPYFNPAWLNQNLINPPNLCPFTQALSHFTVLAGDRGQRWGEKEFNDFYRKLTMSNLNLY